MLRVRAGPEILSALLWLATPWDFLFSIIIFHNILTLYFHKKRRFNSINPFGGNPTFRALNRSGSRDTRWHMTSHAIHVLSRRVECDSHGWAEYRPATSNGPLNRFQVEQQYVIWLLLKIRSVRMLDKIVRSEPLVWLFSPAWDAVILTLDVGFICPFVVIDPTD